MSNPRYVSGDVLELSNTVTLTVTKVDGFGGVPHYGVINMIKSTDLPAPAKISYGWIPVDVLDGSYAVNLSKYGGGQT